MTQRAEPLVGRAAELREIETALDALERGGAGALELVGEPGIGKTRLLGELSRLADERGCLVLSGSASELERDLPFWLFVDALDEYVRSLPPAVLAPLSGELERVLPRGGPRAGTLLDERHRAYEAVRELLALLAGRQPLVLTLDDLHWADPGSLELLGSMLRRPPAAALLLVLAVRPRQVPERLLPALERAQRAGTLTRLELGALSREEAHALHGDAAEEVYEESGGNPFYLQQLARALGRTGHVPRDVTAALSEELALLPNAARALLQGAAIAGDPFVPELAAAAAAIDEPAALTALDDLLEADLVRPTDVPRRFRFRHPLVRRAVYDAAPGGWRLAAHERTAAALEGSVSAQAHHVERCARHGDLAAVAVLQAAGEAAVDTPASAARWFGAALRLLPEDTGMQRLGLLASYARMRAASGDFAAAHEALVAALRIAPLVPLTAACAGVERVLAHHDEARDRLERALGALPDRAAPEAVALMLELAVDGFFRTDYERMWQWARKALAVARGLDDEPMLAASLAMAALADAFGARVPDAEALCDEAAALVDRLPDDQLTRRLDGAMQLMAAELHLDRFESARRHGKRTVALGRATGQGLMFPILLPALASVLEVQGRLADGAELLDGAIEAARLSGNVQALALALMNRSAIASAAGDPETAIRTGEEAIELSRRLGNTVVGAFSGFTLARALLLAGEPAHALEVMDTAGGGEELPRMAGVWRAGGHEFYALCRLALNQPEAAARDVVRAEAAAAAVGLRLPTATAGRAAAALALATGEATAAAEHALTAAGLFDAVGAPVHAALTRVLAGRALATDGDRGGAIAQLERAAEAFEACGAPRRRDEAERELRRLGRTIYRRSGKGGLDTLTARELEIARLVVDRQTNTQIAAALFLSKKTVETHLRNIFGKVGVSSRVELARAVERSDRAA